jgi:hypothetical protein
VFAVWAKFLSPLQGFFNSFIYVRKRFTELTASGGSLAFLLRIDLSASMRRINTPSIAAGDEKSEQGEPSVFSETEATDPGGSLAFHPRINVSASMKRSNTPSTVAGNEKSEQGESSFVSATAPELKIGDQEEGHRSVPEQQQEQEEER